MPAVEQLRAYRLTLDPTPRQVQDLTRHAGAARWAYNHALAAKRDDAREFFPVMRELTQASFTAMGRSPCKHMVDPPHQSRRPRLITPPSAARTGVGAV